MNIDLDLSAAVLAYATRLGPNGGLYRRNDLMIFLRQRGFKVTVPKLNAALETLTTRHKLLDIKKKGKVCWMKADSSAIALGFDEGREQESRERQLRRQTDMMDSEARWVVRNASAGMKIFDGMPLPNRTFLKKIQERAGVGITDIYLFNRFVVEVFESCYRNTVHVEKYTLIRYEKVVAEIQKNWGKNAGIADGAMTYIAIYAFLHRPKASSEGRESPKVGPLNQLLNP